MQFIKTICVVVVLGALAYGAYTTLTGKPKAEPPVETVNWDSPPRIELPGGGDLSLDSNVSLPTGPAGGAAPRYGAAGETSGTARIAPGGPLTGPSLSPTPPTATPAAPSSAAAAPSPYPSTNAVPGPFDGGGAVHLVSNSASQGPALTAPAGGASPYAMPNAVQTSAAASAQAAAAVNHADALSKGQAFLARNDYLHALDEFSKCFDHAGLSPDEAGRVQQLLDQLAGTVIYSRDHLLEPAYVVAQGESLQSIAQKHNVSPQLLAKINGIADPLYLPAGTQLKMVKGPFDAVVDKGQGKLVVFVDGMYAGSFPLIAGFEFPDGSYSVEKISKNGGTSAGGSNSAPVHGIILTGGLAICGTDELSMPTSGDPRGGLRGLSLRDSDDVCDILTVGSKVVVRR